MCGSTPPRTSAFMFLEKWALVSVAKAYLSGGIVGALVLRQSAEYYKCLGRGTLGWNTYKSPIKRVLSHLLWLGPFWGVWGNHDHEGSSHSFFIFQSKTILWDCWKIEESVHDPTTLARYHRFWCIAFHYYNVSWTYGFFTFLKSIVLTYFFGHSFVFGINKL